MHSPSATLRAGMLESAKPADYESINFGGGDADPCEWRRFGGLLLVFEAVLFVSYFLFVDYPTEFTLDGSVQYEFYLDVTIMMLVGFGYLMTFQRKNCLTAVGMTFLITAVCIPWAILIGRTMASLADNTDYPEIEEKTWSNVVIDVNALLQGNFAAAAVLISFGALIGKISPSQTLLLAVLEVPLYSLNKEIFCIKGLGVLDMGGTIFIHLFGAYFGLAAARVIGRPDANDISDSEPSRTSDTFSLIGTVFLWIYWPSFNGATAPLGENQQLLTTVNTVLALCAACLTTFAVSMLINKKFNTVDIQNATLAGGVAVGAASNLKISPAFALLVGAVAGALSTCGFNRLQCYLEERHALHDSCGVHNLHGMPAILGSLVVAVAVSVDSAQGNVVYPKEDDQALAQLLGAAVTLAFALVTGTIVGYILKTFLPKRQGVRAFQDDPFWTVATEKTD